MSDIVIRAERLSKLYKIGVLKQTAQRRRCAVSGMTEKYRLLYSLNPIVGVNDSFCWVILDG